MRGSRFDRGFGTAWAGCAALLALGLTEVGRARGDEARALRGTVRIVGGSGNAVDLSQAVVFVDDQPGLDESGPLPRAEIAQREKQFAPDFLVIARGTTVDFPNWDPYSHNVFSRSRAAPFDLDRYPQGTTKEYTFDQIGLVQIFCNIHPQMRAVILVVPNPYFARADAQGNFTMPSLPPGDYTLVAWHPRAGARRVRARVERSVPVPLEILLQARPAAVAATPSADRQPPGVTRGLGVRRERLDLPVVSESRPTRDTGE